MQVDFSKVTRDAYGRIESPTLVLKKPHGEVIGPLGRAFNVSLDLKYSEVSTAQFEYPYSDGDMLMPFYKDIVKGKLVEIAPFGEFIIETVTSSTDGIQKTITVELQSREYELSEQHLALGEGVYRLCLPRNGAVTGSQEDTLMGYILEAAPGWSIGSVSPSLYTKYRKMPNVDEQVLDFLQGTVQDSYGCVVVFDSFTRSIDLIDIEESVPRLPIYLSYDNLLLKGSVKQLSEPVTTKLYVQGADGVDIRNVNPTGDSYLYNLDWYLERGDLPEALAQRWIAWQNAIFLQQPIYSASVEAKNSLVTKKITAEADLVELQNEKATETNLLDVSVAAKAQASSGEVDYDAQIKQHQANINTIEAKIVQQTDLIESLKEQIDSITASLVSTNNALRISSYFTSDELSILHCYFKEGSFQDTTFAVSDTSNNSDATYITMQSGRLDWSDATIDVVNQTSDTIIALVRDGKLNIVGAKDKNGADLTLTSECVVNATLQVKGSELTATIYAAPFTYGATKHSQCTITMTATVSNAQNLLNGMTATEIAESSYDNTLKNSYVEYTGACSISLNNASMCSTQSATDYQKYSVQQDLYEYAEQYLAEQACPLCEFEVESANFFAAPGYEAFKNKLRLGCGCYLDLDESLMLYPTLIEVHLNIDDNKMQLVFSNSFRRKGDVERLKDVIRNATTASRSFESMRNQYGITGDYVSWVHDFLNGSFDAAKNQIMAGIDNTVTADGTGLTIDSRTGDTCIRLNNGMIALFDKKSNTVKMAMGRFYNDATDEDYVGVLADVIGGTLLAGKNLVIECPDVNGGVIQFKVDSTGVVVNNGRWHMKSAKGCVAIDPNYGFMAGTSSLFELSDTGKIAPACVDASGNLILDADGFPKNINTWIGIDGQVYIRGNIYATDGVFNGKVYASDGEFKGVVYARDGEFTGKVTANSGIFKGTVQADKYLDSSGSSMMANGKWKTGYLDLGNIVLDGDAGDIEMTGDIIMQSDSGDQITLGNGKIQLAAANNKGTITLQNGNVVLDGSIILGGNISWAAANTPVKYKYSTSNNAYVGHESEWHDTMTNYDLYKIESTDGGATWSAPYQFRNFTTQYMYSETNVAYTSNPSAWHTTPTSNDIYRIESHDGGKTWSAPYQYRTYEIIFVYSTTGQATKPSGKANIPSTAPSSNPAAWHLVMSSSDYFCMESTDGGYTWDGPYQCRSYETVFIYAVTNTESVPSSYSSIPDSAPSSSPNAWHRTMSSADYYRRESINNGVSWGPAYQFRGVNGTNGTNGADGKNGSDATVTYEKIREELRNAQKNGLITSTIVEKDGIDTPELNAAEIKGSRIYGCEIFAGDGGSSGTWSLVNDNGFFLKRGASDNERAGLYSVQSSLGSNVDAYTAGLVLGTGSDLLSDTHGRFYVRKYAEGNVSNPSSWTNIKAECIYYTSKGTPVGFTFDDNGGITVHGSLNSYLTFS